MRCPSVSVLIDTYNHERFIEKNDRARAGAGFSGKRTGSSGGGRWLERWHTRNHPNICAASTDAAESEWWTGVGLQHGNPRMPEGRRLRFCAGTIAIAKTPPGVCGERRNLEKEH